MFICLFVLRWPWIGAEKKERKKRAEARMIVGKPQLLSLCRYHPFVSRRRLDKGRVKKNGNCHQVSEHGMEHVSEECGGKISTKERLSLLPQPLEPPTTSCPDAKMRKETANIIDEESFCPFVSWLLLWHWLSVDKIDRKMRTAVRMIITKVQLMSVRCYFINF